MIICRCLQASPRESLGLLKGLADALITDKRPNEAVGEILNARERIRNSGAASAGLKSEGSGPTASETDERIDPVQASGFLPVSPNSL